MDSSSVVWIARSSAVISPPRYRRIGEISPDANQFVG
jgi:hypothetical protein